MKARTKFSFLATLLGLFLCVPFLSAQGLEGTPTPLPMPTNTGTSGSTNLEQKINGELISTQESIQKRNENARSRVEKGLKSLTWAFESYDRELALSELPIFAELVLQYANASKSKDARRIKRLAKRVKRTSEKLLQSVDVNGTREEDVDWVYIQDLMRQIFQLKH